MIWAPVASPILMLPRWIRRPARLSRNFNQMLRLAAQVTSYIRIAPDINDGRGNRDRWSHSEFREVARSDSAKIVSKALNTT